MITALASSSTSVDLSAIGERAFRDRLRTIVGQSGDAVHESSRFWSEFRGANAPQSSGGTLVMGDLAHVVHEWRNLDTHTWTASVRRTLPYFLVFVRTERDRSYAGLVDDLLRSCDMRVTVCNDASDWAEISTCVSRALSAFRSESLLDIRFVPDREQWVVQFGDGFAGVVTLDRIGLSDQRARLILESATIGSHSNVVEVATTEGDVLEIDSASIRGVLDQGFAEEMSAVAQREDRAVGETLRTAREKAGLTQTQLGKRTGLDQAVVSRLETGRNRPRIDTLRRIAQGLGLSVSELLSPSR